ncbi:MAG: hypothetical protein H0T72_05770, partial [Chloroflexia bacterium]|nr:hypothetical protein [Chloroflexia bacterium]
MNRSVSRRQMLRGATGIGLGGFAIGRHAATAQNATPAAFPASDSSLGFVSLRVRQLADASFLTEVNDIVTAEFVPDVQA